MFVQFLHWSFRRPSFPCGNRLEITAKVAFAAGLVIAGKSLTWAYPALAPLLVRTPIETAGLLDINIFPVYDFRATQSRAGRRGFGGAECIQCVIHHSINLDGAF